MGTVLVAWTKAHLLMVFTDPELRRVKPLAQLRESAVLRHSHSTGGRTDDFCRVIRAEPDENAQDNNLARTFT